MMAWHALREGIEILMLARAEKHRIESARASWPRVFAKKGNVRSVSFTLRLLIF